jgi:hypothetical protein
MKVKPQKSNDSFSSKFEEVQTSLKSRGFIAHVPHPSDCNFDSMYLDERYDNRRISLSQEEKSSNFYNYMFPGEKTIKINEEEAEERAVPLLINSPKVLKVPNSHSIKCLN